MNKEIKILDCTLRDGGYVNDWNFGKDTIVNIFERLVSSGVEIIEVGFIDEHRPVDSNRTIQPNSKAYTSNLCHLDKKDAMVVAMIDFGTCPITAIEDAKDSYLDGIRVIFKKAKKDAALDFCRQLIQKGYKVFVQAVSITSYDSEEFAELMSQVNDVSPFAFSIVDTYGLLHKEGLLHYADMADRILDEQIILGYHSHNNFQLAYSNCIEMVKYVKSDRGLMVDGSVFGMGKGAGNAPTELLAMYMNDNYGKNYDLSQILEAIDVSIFNIFKEKSWGYSMKLFISASNGCHPNYVTFLMDKHTLSISTINNIMSMLPDAHKLNYKEKIIEDLYLSYESINIGNQEDIIKLKNELQHKDILLLGPGNSINSESELIQQFIQTKNPIVISLNFIPNFDVDYLFLSNSKRYVQLSSLVSENNLKFKVIALSNIRKSDGRFDFVLDFATYIDNEAEFKDNPLIMVIKILNQISVNSINLAGFDGYTTAMTSDYVHPNMTYSFTKARAIEINVDTVSSLKRNFDRNSLNFLTNSLYTLEIKDLLRKG